MTNIETMAVITVQKSAELAAEGQPPMTPEVLAIAEGKRKTFDLPTNAVKVDPLR